MCCSMPDKTFHVPSFIPFFFLEGAEGNLGRSLPFLRADEETRAQQSQQIGSSPSSFEEPSRMSFGYFLESVTSIFRYSKELK